jgi:hypothetical protein
MADILITAIAVAINLLTQAIRALNGESIQWDKIIPNTGMVKWISEAAGKIKDFLSFKLANPVIGAYGHVPTVQETAANNAMDKFFTETIPDLLKGGFQPAGGPYNPKYGPYGSYMPSEEPVPAKDVVITPGGKVIKTDPADYILATKKPEKIAGGGRAITVNIAPITVIVTEGNAKAAGMRFAAGLYERVKAQNIAGGWH